MILSIQMCLLIRLLMELKTHQILNLLKLQIVLMLSFEQTNLQLQCYDDVAITRAAARPRTTAWSSDASASNPPNTSSAIA